MSFDPIIPRWSGPVIVAAPGPSLTEEIAEQCRDHPVLAINDAWRLLPWAEVLYAADWKWWDYHKGCPDFAGLKVIPSKSATGHCEGARVIKQHKLRVVEGASVMTFSLDPARIHYGLIGTGANGGFQALNLAILFGGNPIIAVGMDMRRVHDKAHFFGEHPRCLIRQQHFSGWVKNISHAAKHLPPHIQIINATPGSALGCFPIMTLAEALKEVSDGLGSRHAA